MPIFPDDMTLSDARSTLREHVDGGVICPVCDQFAKVYRRKINASMAKALIDMYRAGRTGWVHVPTVCDSRSREEAKLRYWGLVEEDQSVGREDGGRAGYWRVTPKGESFVLGLATVPKYAMVYNSEVATLAGPPVSILTALGDKFSYRELMEGTVAAVEISVSEAIEGGHD